MEQTINITINSDQAKVLLVSLLLVGFLKESYTDSYDDELFKQILEKTIKADYKDLYQKLHNNTCVSDQVIKEAIFLLASIKGESTENLDHLIKMIKEQYCSKLN